MDNTVTTLRILIPVTVALVFVALFSVEQVLPLRKRTASLWKRLIVNLCISGIAFVAGFLAVRPVAVDLTAWTSRAHFGLLHLFPVPFVFQFVIGFLLMDLTFYYWHRLNHTVPFLWRFHNVHHVDRDLDVTTSFRFHAIEIVYSTGFRVCQVAMIGTSLIIYIAFELVFQLSTMFHHSNLRLPLKLERVLNTILVTPRMHGIHHSILRKETNSNFSVIFRWWDRLHRTLLLHIPQGKVTIGVPAYREARDNSLLGLVLSPFRRQRDYWRFHDGTIPLRESIRGETRENVIAE